MSFCQIVLLSEQRLAYRITNFSRLTYWIYWDYKGEIEKHIYIFIFEGRFAQEICFLRELTLSWRRPLSYRNQSIDLQSKSMDWFLYDNDFRHERVKVTYLSTSCHWSLSIPPENITKTSGFLILSRVMERDQWHEIG